MSKTDPDGLHPTLIARLRAELNRVRPPDAEPRYLTSRAPIGAWRLAPLMLAIAFTGILALTAFAATGSPNPAVWTNRVETVINPQSPSPESEPTGQPQAVPPAAPPRRPTEQPEPVRTPEPAESPQPSQSPEPSDDHSNEGGSGSSDSAPSPSPPPDH